MSYKTISTSYICIRQLLVPLQIIIPFNIYIVMKLIETNLIIIILIDVYEYMYMKRIV